MELTLRRHASDDPALADVLTLIRDSFDAMRSRIDPPSSVHRLSCEALQDLAHTEEIWSLGQPLSACMILHPRSDVLYVGKLSVAASERRRGLAGRLLDHAASRAHELDLPTLELQTRVELTENHATFLALGFYEVGRTAHDGYTRPTSITFRRSVSQRAPSLT